MSTFRVTIHLGDREGRHFEAVEAWVDTGADYSWLPRSVLERLGYSAESRREFETADGRIIERDVTEVLARLDGRTLHIVTAFGDEGTEPLLGAITLEQFGVGVDPVRRRLVPVRGRLL